MLGPVLDTRPTNRNRKTQGENMKGEAIYGDSRPVTADASASADGSFSFPGLMFDDGEGILGSSSERHRHHPTRDAAG
jgi:hypothetical protein